MSIKKAPAARFAKKYIDGQFRLTVYSDTIMLYNFMCQSCSDIMLYFWCLWGILQYSQQTQNIYITFVSY